MTYHYSVPMTNHNVCLTPKEDLNKILTCRNKDQYYRFEPSDVVFLCVELLDTLLGIVSVTYLGSKFVKYFIL